MSVVPFDHPPASRPSARSASTLAALGLAFAAALAAGCATTAPVATGPQACDDGLARSFRPDADTRVIAVRQVPKGSQLIAVDSPSPVTAAIDLCLVKLLVGPGATAEKDRGARSYTEGIGIEVWLPTHPQWNQRIRDYGGGGWVGGGHREPGKIGSKVPAIVNANLGFAVGTNDAGQPWYQDGSFAWLSTGAVNVESLRDFTHRATIETALKTRALARLYYGEAPRFAYYDGQSQGGRQGMKVMQERPELYDGYLIAQPAVSVPRFGLASFNPQLVMKSELGFNATDKVRAAAFATKVQAANARAVKACDAAGLGWILDPFACDYDPLRDAAGLCAGVQGRGVTGTGSDAAQCMSAAEARALARIWYGPSRDGRDDPAQTSDGRSGRSLGAQQLWWGFTRGTAIGGGITRASTDNLALAMQDVAYAGDASVTSGTPIVNASTAARNRWTELDNAAFAAMFGKAPSLPWFADYMTDRADLSALRSQGRKVIVHNGLADDAIPPAGAVNWYERVVAAAGGHAQVQSFMRMYMVPGMAHSSQGRAYTVGGRNDAVPMPALPGNANQRPGREQDQMFTALQDWVERGVAPGNILVTSRDRSISYPICVYPLKTGWTGGPVTQPSSFRCQ